MEFCVVLFLMPCLLKETAHAIFSTHSSSSYNNKFTSWLRNNWNKSYKMPWILTGAQCLVINLNIYFNWIDCFEICMQKIIYQKCTDTCSVLFKTKIIFNNKQWSIQSDEVILILICYKTYIENSSDTLIYKNYRSSLSENYKRSKKMCIGLYR